MDVYTLLGLKWITNEDLLHSTGNSAQLYAAAWMEGDFRGEWIHAHVWLRPFAIHPKLLTIFLIGYTPIQTKKLKKKKDKV